MRLGTIESKMAAELMLVGECYKTDLLLFGRAANGNEAAMPTKALKKLLEEELVTTRKIPKEGNAKQTKEAVLLTRKGKNTVVDLLNDEFLYKHYKEYGTEFHTSVASVLRLRLLDSRIKIMFSCANIPAYKNEKPSLPRLARTLGNNTIRIDDEIDSHYIQLPAPEDYRKFLDNGVYYTVKEIREFLDAQSPGESDTTLRSRTRGVFISSDKCIVVYISPVGNNRIMRLSAEGERKFINKLKDILDVTYAKRNLPSLTKKELQSDGKYHYYENIRQGDVYALMISDTDSMVYAMATGNRNGITRGDDMEEVQASRVKNARKKDKSPKYVWLTGNRNLYRRVFVTPFTYNGTVCLDYLCHTKVEKWAETSAKIMSAIPDITENKIDPIYPGTILRNYEKVPAIFLPVFEVTELREISKSDKEVCVVTYEDMANAIAHSIKKEAIYYDVETLKRIEPESVMIYDENGREKGRAILESYLSANNIECKKKEYFDLPEKFNMTYTEFYNAIAKGIVTPEAAASGMNGSPKKQKEEKAADGNTVITIRVTDQDRKSVV